MLAYADLVRQGKVLYVGVSEWRAEQIAAAAELARELRVPLISNQPQYSMLWRVIEAEVVPTCEREGIGQIVFSPIGQGVLTGKYQPGAAPPAGSRATDESGGADFIRRMLTDDVLTRVQKLRPIAEDVRAVDGAARGGLGAAEPERLGRDHRRQPAGAGRARTSRPPACGWSRRCWPRIDEALGDVVERDPARTAGLVRPRAGRGGVSPRPGSGASSTRRGRPRRARPG